MNETVEAVGFDFIRRPELEFRVGLNGSKETAIQKRSEFSPDFFPKQGDHIFAVEVKGDEEMGDPSPKRQKAYIASEHFERLNEWLARDKSSARYQFNMISPKSFNVFFQKLREGELATFRSELDVAMTKAAKTS